MTIQFPILLNNWQGDTAATVFTAFDGQQWAAYREPDAIPVEEKPEFKVINDLIARLDKREVPMQVEIDEGKVKVRKGDDFFNMGGR